MHLLYLSYWGVADGLTQATVLPHLEVLQASSRIEKLLLVTIERGPPKPFTLALEPSRVKHIPLQARRIRPTVAARALDFIEVPQQLARICRDEGVGYVLARGTPAGALAHLMQRRLRLSYAVESFEPHAAYMLESGVWHRWDPRFLLQRRWEEAQKRGADVLLPVAESYRQLLTSEGVSPERMVTLPCTVDTDRFGFDPKARREVRAELCAGPGDVIGIYVGKFGGIYYEAEAFRVFARFAERLPAFRLIVLSPAPSMEVRRLAAEGRFPADRLFVTEVPHGEVPRYLSAADVGFATIRMAASRRFCSPVKIGEYWAAGLPVVITQGIGDDSGIVDRHDAGAVISLSPGTIDQAAERIRHLLDEAEHRTRIAGLAKRFRSRTHVRDAYARLGWLA